MFCIVITQQQAGEQKFNWFVYKTVQGIIDYYFYINLNIYCLFLSVKPVVLTSRLVDWPYGRRNENELSDWHKHGDWREKALHFEYGFILLRFASQVVLFIGLYFSQLDVFLNCSGNIPKILNVFIYYIPMLLL